MANVDRAQGLLPVKHYNGAPWNGQVEQCLVTTADSTAIFIGDIVAVGGTAGAAGYKVNGIDCEGMMTVAKSTETATCVNMLGVVVGFLPDPTALTNKHRLASTDRIALVCTDTSVVYEIQEDGVGNNVAASMVGLACGVTTTAGNATTGVSAFALDSSTTATTATLPLKIVGLVKRPDNALGTASTDKGKFLVLINGGFPVPATAGTA
jgi:hypothetical protein